MQAVTVRQNGWSMQKYRLAASLSGHKKITVGKTLRKLHNRIHVQELADEEGIRKGRHASKQVERESLET